MDNFFNINNNSDSKLRIMTSASTFDVATTKSSGESTFKFDNHIGTGSFEFLCKNCGECCGALDDPCKNLGKNEKGKYYCKKYHERFGPQETLSGAQFKCVSIREHIKNDSLRMNCGYRKHR